MDNFFPPVELLKDSIGSRPRNIDQMKLLEDSYNEGDKGYFSPRGQQNQGTNPKLLLSNNYVSENQGSNLNT